MDSATPVKKRNILDLARELRDDIWAYAVIHDEPVRLYAYCQEHTAGILDWSLHLAKPSPNVQPTDATGGVPQTPFTTKSCDCGPKDVLPYISLRVTSKKIKEEVDEVFQKQVAFSIAIGDRKAILGSKSCMPTPLPFHFLRHTRRVEIGGSIGKDFGSVPDWAAHLVHPTKFPVPATVAASLSMFPGKEPSVECKTTSTGLTINGMLLSLPSPPSKLANQFCRLAKKQLLKVLPACKNNGEWIPLALNILAVGQWEQDLYEDEITDPDLLPVFFVWLLGEIERQEGNDQAKEDTTSGTVWGCGDDQRIRTFMAAIQKKHEVDHEAKRDAPQRKPRGKKSDKTRGGLKILGGTRTQLKMLKC